jgi:lambda repressor-like predicted transcriptional regulator
MDAEDIKANLRKRGSSLAKIAKSLGITPSAVSYALWRGRSRLVEQKIASILEKELVEVFPDRYLKEESKDESTTQ